MGKKNIEIILFILFLLLIFFCFRSWFSFFPLSSGDWNYKFPEMIRGFTLYPYAWDAVFFNGLGGNKVFLLSLNTYYLATISILFNFFHIPWVLIERLVWFWPFLIISVSSSYYLFRKLFSEKFALLSSFVFLFNIYILMIVGGGQMGIAMAYSIAPIVLASFIQIINNLGSKGYNFKFQISNFKLPILAGSLLSLQIIFDLRIAYITLFAVFLLWLLKNIEKTNLKFFIKSFALVFLIPGAISFLLNTFWLLPSIVSSRNPIEDLGSAYSSVEAVKFFSFAKFEDSISLLHPNWPENIFGKTGFLKPEFLLRPILAFSSLFFISKTKDQRTKSYILFFALLGLIGAFLAKGANEPFGGIYLWMFDHLPGFIMFRDPTKWYTLVAISYSILIPFTVWKIYEWLKSKDKFSIFNFQFSIKSKIFNFQNLFLILTSLFLILLIRPALFGQLSGTFKTTQVPEDYIKLEKFLSSQNSFSRTLWIPTIQRFGYYSNSHPAIPAQSLFKTVENTEIIKKMNTQETELFLQEAGVKYVIVPYDSQGEIFLKDRKYNNKIYQKTINEVKQISYLKQINYFGKIAVFEVSNPKDHFYFSNQQSAISNQKLTYQYISPVEYKLEVGNAKIGDKIIFAENYDASWMARDSNATFYDWSNLISSNPYSRIFNSFALRKDGNYSLIVYYYPQILVNIGMVISSLSLVLILSALIYLKKKKI